MAMVIIRCELPSDIAVRELLLDDAFGERRAARTSERLREGRLPADGLSFTATDEDRVVGTVRMWDISAGPGRSALLLGPLAVEAGHRDHGIGGRLISHAVDQARSHGYSAVLLVGDAPYYGRFGFSAGKTGALWLPGPYERHRLLGQELTPGALDGARGLVSATGRLRPLPDLPTMIARLAAEDLGAPSRAA